MDITKQQLLADKFLVGIDPAKAKHQALVLSPEGLQLGKSFCFDVSHEGYTTVLWKKLSFLIPNCNSNNTLFALETSSRPTILLESVGFSDFYRFKMVRVSIMQARFFQKVTSAYYLPFSPYL